MKPYYQDDFVTLYHGDALTILPSLRADVAITDPPYGISDKPFLTAAPRKGRRVGTSNTWHAESEWDNAINPAWCEAVCDSASVVAWFGHWRKRGEVERAMPFPIRAEIVWAKDCHVGPPCPLAMRDERIWLFAPAAIEGQRFETSVWDEAIIPTWSKKWHKNEKPLNLMLRLVSFLTQPGQAVLDPFCGSGTTLVAAKHLGRKAIGIDSDASHCASAVERLSQETLGLDVA